MEVFKDGNIKVRALRIVLFIHGAEEGQVGVTANSIERYHVLNVMHRDQQSIKFGR